MKTHVKINASRGYGSGIFRVRSCISAGSESTLTVAPLAGGKTFNIYEALTYQDIECLRLQREAAQKIGRK